MKEVNDMNGRGERIRTSDLSVPNRAHYQAVLRPENLTVKYLERLCILRGSEISVKSGIGLNLRLPVESLCPLCHKW